MHLRPGLYQDPAGSLQLSPIPASWIRDGKGVEVRRWDEKGWKGEEGVRRAWERSGREEKNPQTKSLTTALMMMMMMMMMMMCCSRTVQIARRFL